MTKEEYVKHLIKSTGHSVKSFAKSIDLPYTTLLGMLKNGLGGSALDNVVRVCRGLGISVENLTQLDGMQNPIIPFHVDHHERLLITQYRCLPEMRLAVDTLLGISKASENRS